MGAGGGRWGRAGWGCHPAIKILDTAPTLLSGLLKTECQDLQSGLARVLHHKSLCLVPTDGLGLTALPLPHTCIDLSQKVSTGSINNKTCHKNLCAPTVQGYRKARAWRLRLQPGEGRGCLEGGDWLCVQLSRELNPPVPVGCTKASRRTTWRARQPWPLGPALITDLLGTFPDSWK